jgi:hypothetical protein
MAIGAEQDTYIELFLDAIPSQGLTADGEVFLTRVDVVEPEGLGAAVVAANLASPSFV